MPRKDNVIEFLRPSEEEPLRNPKSSRGPRRATSEEMVEMLRNFERVKKPDVRRTLIELVAQLAN
jgi:hypothetical protein